MAPAVVLAVIAVAAVAQAAMQYQAAQQSEEAAKKKEKLQKEQLSIQKETRALDQKRALAQLARDTREKQATLLNNASQQGVQYSSSYLGGDVALESARKREAGAIGQYGELANKADEVTTKQIELDTQVAIQNAENKKIGAIVGGVSTIAKAYGSYSGYGT